MAVSAAVCCTADAVASAAKPDRQLYRAGPSMHLWGPTALDWYASDRLYVCVVVALPPVLTCGASQVLQALLEGLDLLHPALQHLLVLAHLPPHTSTSIAPGQGLRLPLSCPLVCPPPASWLSVAAAG